MQASIEITYAPLQNNYEDLIKTFIRALRDSPFEVVENPLSTQIYGELGPMMQFLEVSISNAFSALDAGMVQLKIVKSNRSSYVPFD